MLKKIVVCSLSMFLVGGLLLDLVDLAVEVLEIQAQILLPVDPQILAVVAAVQEDNHQLVVPVVQVS